MTCACRMPSTWQGCCAVARRRHVRSFRLTSSGSRHSILPSTPSSPVPSMRRWPGPRPLMRRWPVASRRACCTACRSRTRISPTRQGCGLPMGHRFSPRTCLTATRWWSSGWRKRARSAWARRTRPSSARARTPLIRSSGLPAILTTSAAALAAAAAALAPARTGLSSRSRSASPHVAGWGGSLR